MFNLFIPRKSRCILLFLLPVFVMPSMGQSSPEPLKTASIGLIGINTMVTSMILKQHKLNTPVEAIQTLNREDVSRFDRSATYQNSQLARKWSDYIATSSTFLPFTVLSNNALQKNWKNNGLMMAETYLLTAGITNLTKELVQRKRPFLYNPDVPLSEKLKADATSSFFSGHTSMTAASCFLTASMWSNQLKGNEQAAIWTSAAVIPAVVGFLRWKGGKHYWTDIITGYAVGAAIGILIPKIQPEIQP